MPQYYCYKISCCIELNIKGIPKIYIYVKKLQRRINKSSDITNGNEVITEMITLCTFLDLALLSDGSGIAIGGSTDNTNQGAVWITS